MANENNRQIPAEHRASSRRGRKTALLRVFWVFCIILSLLAGVTICYAAEHGHGGHGGHGGHARGEWHGHGGFGIFIGPGPYYPYPYYPYYPYYPDCDRVCSDRVVRVCNYDYWGERWCHDQVVRECRRVCY